MCNPFFFSSLLQNLKEVLAAIIPEKQQEVAEFRKKHGKTKVGEVTVDMVCKLTSFQYCFDIFY